jgi:orotate phosphoribosyltransferase-like protein
MSKKTEFIELLKEMKNTNVTYKQIANELNIKVNSLYTWIQKGNISEKRAAYLLRQIERAFPDEYIYATIMNGAREVEKELREAL